MKRTGTALVMVGLIGLMVLAGCRDHPPHAFTLVGGDVGRMHAKPAEGGYYTNWDPYAVELEVKPLRDVNPVKTQHVIIATVKDSSGKPLPNRRVEWIIPKGSVGTIVEGDESGWRATRGHKITENFAVTHTNNFDHVLTRGNSDPKDDIHLKRGQTWCVITSPIEGTTHMIVYAPGIYDWKKHKVFAAKHWLDVAWKLPPAATNRVGTNHTFTTKVTKYSDGTPLAGYVVDYQIVSGPPAMLQPGGGQTASVKTDAKGLGSETNQQQGPKEGTNVVAVKITRPEDKQCCRPAQLIHVGKTSKTWVAPAIKITKTAPATAILGQQFNYNITVTNPGRAAANNVVVTDVLPAGIAYVSSTPKAQVAGQTLTWSLGSLPSGGSRGLVVAVKGTRTGKFINPAEVRASDGLSDRATAPTVITQAKLALTKTGPAEVIQCDAITYQITVRNVGTAPATNVAIKDTLPAGMKTLDGRQSVTIPIGTLAPNAAKVVPLKVKAAKTGTFTNAATATADGGLTASASAKTIVRIPKLVVTKTGPAKRYINRPVVYTITVANQGDAEARNTVLVDTLPAGATFQSASAGGAASGGKVTWNLGTLAPKASKKVSVTVVGMQKGTLTNVANATAYCAAGSAKAQTAIEGIPAILLECVDIADPIEVGANETYVITVTNQGSAVGTNIQVTATLPAQQDFVSTDGPTKGTAKGKVITFAPLKTLAPKAQATFKVIAKGNAVGDVRFTVSLKSDQMTSPASETESTHIYK